MTPVPDKNCLACHQPVAAEQLVICHECQAPYHRQCWQSRGGCAMPGCAANPASSAASGSLPPAPPGNVPGLAGPQKTSGLAIASLVLGILGIVTCIGGIVLSPIGLILGIVANSSINKDSGLGGKGLAIAGIVVSGLYLLFIPITASVLFPVFAKAREKARQSQCMSQLRQLATATQMYAQDNDGQFPGKDWVTQIAPYVGDSHMMFRCPSDAAADTSVSYGYSAAMVTSKGHGIHIDEVVDPAGFITLCDASPSPIYPEGGLVGDPGKGATVAPDNRHSRGITVGYNDGHVEFHHGGFVEGDEENEVYRSLYLAEKMGYITRSKTLP